MTMCEAHGKMNPTPIVFRLKFPFEKRTYMREDAIGSIFTTKWIGFRFVETQT